MTYDELRSEWNSDSKILNCHTSGSTGKPTLIELSKEFLLESARRTNLYFKISTNSLLYSCIAADYIGGKMMWIRSVESGADFLYENPSNKPLLNAKINKTIDLISVVPSQMQYIVDNLDKLPEIKTYLVGGAPLSGILKRKIIEKGLDVYESYGMTETASHIALRKVQAGNNPFRTLDGIRVEEVNNKLKIIFEKNGYEVVTNDLAELTSDREFYILGRSDNIINSGGIKISIEKLESLVSGILEFGITFTSVPDSKWGEALTMIVEGRDVELEIAKQKLANILTRHNKPKHYLSIEKLPLTPNGKLNRAKIKEFAYSSCKIV